MCFSVTYVRFSAIGVLPYICHSSAMFSGNTTLNIKTLRGDEVVVIDHNMPFGPVIQMLENHYRFPSDDQSWTVTSMLANMVTDTEVEQSEEHRGAAASCVDPETVSQIGGGKRARNTESSSCRAILAALSGSATARRTYALATIRLNTLKQHRRRGHSRGLF
ncbi:unnamed protein product [Symbiodinium natans]|uniref:Uncharacterized protein n=1 Tax=Symbiodinium natans TaxID=878477 RepID=A0A812LM65_9DINO|nr:unnamed protein product [Symbiodinium natans]